MPHEALLNNNAGNLGIEGNRLIPSHHAFNSAFSIYFIWHQKDKSPQSSCDRFPSLVFQGPHLLLAITLSATDISDITCTYIYLLFPYFAFNLFNLITLINFIKAYSHYFEAISPTCALWWCFHCELQLIKSEKNINYHFHVDLVFNVFFKGSFTLRVNVIFAISCSYYCFYYFRKRRS